jgi:hypothetical protein
MPSDKVVEWREPWSKDFARLGPYTIPTQTIPAIIPFAVLYGLFGAVAISEVPQPPDLDFAVASLPDSISKFLSGSWFNSAIIFVGYGLATTGVFFLSIYGSRRYICLTEKHLIISPGKHWDTGFRLGSLLGDGWGISKHFAIDKLGYARIETNADADHSLLVSYRGRKFRLVIDTDETAEKVRDWLSEIRPRVPESPLPHP